MATIESDVYVKFGDDKDSIDPETGDTMALVLGDCTDDLHYWWCELRSCGFTLTVPDPVTPTASTGGAGAGGAGGGGTGGDTDKKKPKPEWPKVSLKKRIDWASSRLFFRCCRAGQQKIEKVKADKTKQDPTLDQVTVHVCKTAGGRKFPFIVIWYRGVQITDYKISMSGPEPEETVDIEFDSYEFGYQPTDPTSGLPTKDGLVKTGRIERDKDPVEDQEREASLGGITAVSVAATSGVTTGTGSAGNGSSSTGLSSATEGAVSVNFPGLWQGNGFGVLPD